MTKKDLEKKIKNELKKVKDSTLISVGEMQCIMKNCNCSMFEVMSVARFGMII